jgi:hypothetical protein
LCLEKLRREYDTSAEQTLQDYYRQIDLMTKHHYQEMENNKNVVKQLLANQNAYYSQITKRENQIIKEFSTNDQEDIEKIRESQVSSYTAPQSLASFTSEYDFTNTHKEISISQKGSQHMELDKEPVNSLKENNNNKQKVQDNNVINVKQEFKIESMDTNELEENSLNSSMHKIKPKTAKEIKYYAGMLSANAKESDGMIINSINNMNILNYRLTAIG